MNLKKWDACTDFMKGSGEEVWITNRYITEVSNKLFEIYTAFKRKDENVSADDIKMSLQVNLWL